MQLRARALERRKLPNELDHLSGLARPWTWLGVLAVTLAVAALVVWSFAGTIPRTSSGPGVIAQPGSLSAVQSIVSGRVSHVDVRVGSEVKAGQLIATVRTGPHRFGPQLPIRALFAGRIGELDIITGQVVQVGAPLYTLQRITPRPYTEVYLFLPSKQGAGLAPGMSVNVSVQTAPTSAFGVLRGKVESVSETPLSVTAVTALVANPTLADELTNNGPPVLVRVELIKDSRTVSGFSWSTPKGPPFPLQPGTPVTAQIVQSQQRPVDVIFGT